MRMLEIYQAMNRGDFSRPEVRAYRDRFKKFVVDSTNHRIRKKVEANFPNLYFTRKAKEEMHYAANEVSAVFSSPTELIGVLDGRKEDNNLILDSFNTFHNQYCNKVISDLDPFGKIITLRQLRQQEKTPLSFAHSHNTMGTFHSSLDNIMLEDETDSSTSTFDFQIDGKHLICPYSISTVFNQRGNLYVKAGVLAYEMQLDGRFRRKYISFEPKFLTSNLGSLDDDSRSRLDREIRDRVTYQHNINNRGFTNEF